MAFTATGIKCATRRREAREVPKSCPRSEDPTACARQESGQIAAHVRPGCLPSLRRTGRNDHLGAHQLLALRAALRMLLGSFDMDSTPRGRFPDDLIQCLQSAQRVAVLTGAGISAESGVPTFREAQTGLWERFRAEDLATPEAFHRNPRLVWEWYAWRRELVSRAQPNLGHLAILEMELRFAAFTLITQNVDGLHQRAGSGGRFPVIELHGNPQRTKCWQEDCLVETWTESDEVPPRCPRCGGLLRPDVVWFGEMLPRIALQAARDAAQGCEVFFSIGTSGLVEPAASLPYLALQAGRCVIEVNPDATPLTSQASFVLNGPAGKILPELARTVWETSEKA